MYFSLNSPLYISQLTEIAQSVKTLYRVEAEGRKRDLKGLSAIFWCSFQMRGRHIIKTPITNLLVTNPVPCTGMSSLGQWHWSQGRRLQFQVMLGEKSCSVLPMTHGQAAWAPPLPRQSQGQPVPLTVTALSVTLPFSCVQHFHSSLFLWKV